MYFKIWRSCVEEFRTACIECVVGVRRVIQANDTEVFGEFDTGLRLSRTDL